MPSFWLLASNRGQTEGHADALVLLALPHEPHVRAVGMANEEVHVEVAQIHLGDQVVAVNEQSNSMQPLHFEMLVLNAAVGLSEVHRALHRVGAFLRYGEESRRKTVKGLRWQLLDGADLDVVL